MTTLLDRPHAVVLSWQLECRCCSRAMDCPHADLMRYLAVGWPSCCGEVMVLRRPVPTPDPHYAHEARP